LCFGTAVTIANAYVASAVVVDAGTAHACVATIAVVTVGTAHACVVAAIAVLLLAVFVIVHPCVVGTAVSTG
jgi:hypothetical protein